VRSLNEGPFHNVPFFPKKEEPLLCQWFHTKTWVKETVISGGVAEGWSKSVKKQRLNKRGAHWGGEEWKGKREQRVTQKIGSVLYSDVAHTRREAISSLCARDLCMYADITPEDDLLPDRRARGLQRKGSPKLNFQTEGEGPFRWYQPRTPRETWEYRGDRTEEDAKDARAGSTKIKISPEEEGGPRRKTRGNTQSDGGLGKAEQHG